MRSERQPTNTVKLELAERPCFGRISTLHVNKLLIYNVANVTLESFMDNFSVPVDPVVGLNRLPVEKENV